MPEISVVIPAFNEEDKITSTLTQVVNFLKSYVDSFEVVVVNDGSLDKTSAVVREYSISNPEVVLIDNPHKGKGFAIYTGMMHAKGDYIYMADADLSAQISEIKKLILWIKEHNYDIVIATREGVGARRVDEPYYRHFMGRVFNLLVQIVALPGINDSQCGFKLFTNKAAKDSFSRLRIYGAGTKEIKKPYLGAMDVEVLYIAKKHGYKIKEVPVTWTFVKTTRLAPFATSLKMAMDVFMIRINDLKGLYN